MNILTITREADADLSASQYLCMKASADNGCALAGANEKVLGVLQNDPAADRAAAIQIEGVTRVKTGGAVAVGDYLKSDANGKAVAAAGEAAGVLVEVFAVALEAAAGADELINAHLTRVVINRAAT